MNANTLRVGIDVGSKRHRVAVGLPSGEVVDGTPGEHQGSL